MLNVDTVLLVVVIGGWLGVAIFLTWLWLRNQSRALPKPVREKIQATGQEAVLLAIEVPKENEKTPLAAETLFSSLHGIGSSHLSFEIEAKEKSIRFYVWVPIHLRGYVESQLYAQYPDINILEAKDYAEAGKVLAGLSAVSTELAFSRKDFFPIKTFQNFDVDPLAAITGILSKLEEGERVWIQILIRPEDDRWRDRAINFISAAREGRSPEWGKAITKGLAGFAGEVLRTAVRGGTYEETTPKKIELSPGADLVLKAIEEKSSKLGFRAKLRLVVLHQSAAAAQNKLQLALGAFKQFNTNNLNSFVAGRYSNDTLDILARYRARDFGPGGLIMNVTELASIYHLPNMSVATPNIVWAGSRKGEPPANLPLMEEVPANELTVLASTNFRGGQEKFGIKLKDRHRHVYIIGKSGTGKSTLLENMTIDDIRERRGVAVIDPHGDYVDTVMQYVPNYRVNDIVLFDPGDGEYPIAFNMLEVPDPKYKVVVASGVVGIFKKIFGYSWGPRLEYWLSSAVLALLDYPEATLVMIPRMFTDVGFREKVIAKIQDPLIKTRWINEYGRLDQRQQNETISPILNKVGQFLSSPVIRNIVGQPRSSIDFRKVMDEGKVLLVKLAKGIIGEDNAALLGAMVITQLQLASMTRADIAEAERKDFYLYVDEFQNFATESFQTILSESRKYHLSLTLANQYMDQLIPEVSDAVFGNVNTIIAFRVGGDDAKFLEREFAPVFDANDLVNLSMFNVYVKLSIDNVTTNAFSAQTLPLPADRNDNMEKIIKLSRERYAKPAEFVEEKIGKTFEMPEGWPSRGPREPQGDQQRRRLPDRPVPFRPGLRVGDAGRAPAASKPQRPPKKKPQSSLLKKVIAAIEQSRPWVPPADKKKPNVVADLNAGKDRIEDVRRQRSDESQLKEGEWVSLDELQDNQPKDEDQ
ncbi:hypothetical protein A2V68_03175 [candidate division Kazan bacterium RBG_13_50_9]|uniref:Type IV secretion system coupling protein TraD DNA-binding domain-containing protein n=1 Tax=candidate division Kazan bacterium RBG_13_50_9 TaxID=1798535 RepID=A0A1F4NUP2_UNCK3|nr:MAG: hypothetical protein A2V68_03175 [candidate division Kazan bacterium RBG_13_50_9]